MTSLQHKDSLGLPAVLQSPSPSQQLVASAPNNAISDDEVVKDFVLNSSLSKVRSFTIGVSQMVTEHFWQKTDGFFHQYWRGILQSQFYRFFDKLSDYLAFRCMFSAQRLTTAQMFATTVVCISVAFVQLHNSLIGRTSLTIQEIQESFNLYQIIMQQDRQWIESIEYLPISDFGKKMLGIRDD
ncbi:hypothetical protein MP228_004415 [Amoeboaphelidium protococcarum]|nr:hypothetical protein MP228_004415 [Amoeboaphelidium protococcarum]